MSDRKDAINYVVNQLVNAILFISNRFIHDKTHSSAVICDILFSQAFIQIEQTLKVKNGLQYLIRKGNTLL